MANRTGWAVRAAACLLLWAGVSTAAPAEVLPSEHLVKEGLAALDLHAYDAAVLQFERAVTVEPTNARAFAYLGYAHAQAGRADLAAKYYAIALEIDPAEIKALLWSGQMDVSAQDLPAARTKLTRLERACTAGCEEYRVLKHSVRMLIARLQRQ